jgi:hypothetical protein
MPRRYRYAAVARLRRMEQEISGENLSRIGWTSEIHVEGGSKKSFGLK